MNANVLGAELYRMLRLTRSYWLEYAADFILYFAGFLLLMAVFSASAETFSSQGVLSSLIGYVVWKICASTFLSVARIADEEARTGTLEQMFLTSQSPFHLFLARSFSIFINQALRGMLLGLVLGAALGVLVAPTWLSILIFILTFVSALGLGLAMAGLVLINKRVGGFLTLIWQMLVFFSGALAPMPDGPLTWISRLLPLSWGVSALRSALITGSSITDLWQTGLLPGLLLNTLVYIAVGTALFVWGERQARFLGVLGHY